LPPVCFEADVNNVLVDDFADPATPATDVIFNTSVAAHLGHPATLIQGYKMFAPQVEDEQYLSPGPKFCVAKWLVNVGVEEVGLAAHRFYHVPPAIDHELFRPEQRGQRDIDVVALSHPHKEKGWPVAREAISALLAQRPGLRVVVFGRDRPDDLPDGARFIPHPSHQQLANEVYGRAKIFVQTSFHEGFGLTPVEAMACGAALVSTDCGGSGDYAIDYHTGRVVPSGDPSKVVGAVNDLLNDDVRRQTLAETGERFVRGFSWERSAAVMEAGLQDYLADPSKFPRLPPRKETP
jgi:glycosyltransferase involved in cell wall biosynthesis